jgi:RNA polymerase sigma-70 factor, ECF subfamily
MSKDKLTQNDLVALLHASRNGNEQALALMAKVLLANAISFFRAKQLSRDLIDELSQEALESILNSLDKVKKPESLESFAFKLCIRQWHNHLASKKGRMEQFEDDIDELYESEIKHYIPVRDSDGNLNPLFDPEGRIDITAVLFEIPPMYREAIMMKYLEQQTYEEISEQLDISVENARKRVSRGISIMRAIID